MESSRGSPSAEALGAELPRRPLSPAGPQKPDGAAAGLGGGGGPRRALRVAYVCNESLEDDAADSPEEGAFQCLVGACEAEGAHLTTMPLEVLDFEEAAKLDAFYYAGEADAPFSPVPFLSALLTLGRAGAPARPHLSTPDSFDRSAWPGNDRVGSITPFCRQENRGHRHVGLSTLRSP